MPDQSPPTALVVEDEYLIGLMVEELLKDRGFVVTVASTLQEGIAAIQRQAFSIAVLDCMLRSDSTKDLAKLDTRKNPRGLDGVVIH